jgi:hypothetical protein
MIVYGDGRTEFYGNLGVYGAGHNVTSYEGYQVNGAAPSGQYLRGNGTNFVSSAIQASDIPNLNASYIRNGTAQQSSSNFNISGDGTVGGQLLAGTLGVGTTSPGATIEAKSTSSASVLRVSRPNGNADIEMNSTFRPTIYPHGPNIPSTGMALQIRSDGTESLQLNNDDGGDILIGGSAAQGGSNVGIGPMFTGATPAARLDVDGSIIGRGDISITGAADITRNMGTVGSGTYYGLTSSISTGTGNVVNTVGVYGASSGTDDVSTGVQGQGTGTGGGLTMGGDFSAHNVSNQGTAIAVRADATGAAHNIAVEATHGDVYVTDPSKGIILKDGNNNCWRVTVNTSGQLVTTQLSSCPN